MIMERVPYNSFNVAEKRFKIKNCSEDVDTIKQVKMVPECKNIKHTESIKAVNKNYLNLLKSCYLLTID